MRTTTSLFKFRGEFYFIFGLEIERFVSYNNKRFFPCWFVRETAKRIRRSLVPEYHRGAFVRPFLSSAIAEKSASVLEFRALGRTRSHLTPSRHIFNHLFPFSHNLLKPLYLGFQCGVHHVHNPWGSPRGDHGVRPRFYPPRSEAKFLRFLGVPRRPRRGMRGCHLCSLRQSLLELTHLSGKPGKHSNSSS